MRNPVSVLLFIGALLLLLIFGRMVTKPEPTYDLELLKERYPSQHVASVDHSKLPALQGKFDKPSDVTRACVSCHTERHKELLESTHWKWEREAYIPGRGVTYAGKKNLINNFCIGIGSNEQSCNRCHAGYGWEDNSFDFSKWENIDCLVCHDNSAVYVKGIGMAGYPEPDVDLSIAAQGVGLPTTWNCGSCHFFSGGGNNVKHGDLEVALVQTTRDVDVHMGQDAGQMQCVDCHEAENHKMLGKMYSVSSSNEGRMNCEKCHGPVPHETSILNEHSVKVACQTCHIPEFAKVNATKMHWDWSTAGKLDENGEPMEIVDENGNDTYLSIKGSFVWKKHVQPEYQWFNGTADHYFLGDKVDTTQVIPINTLFGEYSDPASKIIPVKVHRARQIYDCSNNTIIQPRLYAVSKGEGAYWKDFDWDIAARLGMEAIGEPYSGNFCWVDTKMNWPVNHMVSPADKALSCEDCHTREDGRLAALTDFYMPGRDRNKTIDVLGLIIILASLAGVLTHALIRIAASSRRGGGK